MYLESGKYYHIYNHANGFENIFRKGENFSFFLEKYKFHLSAFFDTYAYCLMPNHFHFLVRVKSCREIVAALEEILKPTSTSPTSTKFETPSPTSTKFETSLKFMAKEELPPFFSAAKTSPGSRFNAYKKTLRKLEALKELTNSNCPASEVEEFLQIWISRQLGDLFSSYTQSFNKQNKRMGGLFIHPFQRKEVMSDDYLRTLVVYIHNNPVYHGFFQRPDEWVFSSYNEIINNENHFVDSNTVIKWFSDFENFVFCHNITPDIDFDYTFE